MPAPDRLSEFLRIVTDQSDGTATRKGAIIFVSLSRALDRMIQHSLSLGQYHRGTPSPWSHTFLLAEDFHGPDTPIVECSIRTNDGHLVWDEDHSLSLIDILTNHDQSGILQGTVKDYDDPHVGNVGIKWLETTSAEREQLIRDALDPRWKDTRYDIPGLFRELLRLWSKNTISVPPGQHLLFCSAYVQVVYAQSLNVRFNPAVRNEDATPDDLWYAGPGQRQGPITVNPDVVLPRTGVSE